jgi:menaquinone-dependent protoporphyrinogen IX oxidase
MMKAVVIYRSKTGSAKTYAEWIAEELKADIFELSKVNSDIFSNYDTVIYGGGLYAVGINGIKFIKNNLEKLKDKNVVVYASGASPSREEVINEIINRNFTSEEQKYIKFFYLRGGFDYNKLGLLNKLLMKLVKQKIMRKVKKKIQLDPDEMGMLAAYDKPTDFKRKKNIGELIAYVNSK